MSWVEEGGRPSTNVAVLGDFTAGFGEDSFFASFAASRWAKLLLATGAFFLIEAAVIGFMAPIFNGIFLIGAGFFLFIIVSFFLLFF